MPKTTRTFIALPIPGPIKGKLERLQRLVAPDLPAVRWVEPAGFHLTLAFLGDVHDPDLDALCRSVATAVAGFGPVALQVRGLGAFPDLARPRVLWAGVEGEVEALGAIRAAVARAATASGYRPDDDRFHPHVTLGRLKLDRDNPVDLAPLESRRRGWMGGSFTGDTVITYASGFDADGPAYSALGSARLGGEGRA